MKIYSNEVMICCNILFVLLNIFVDGVMFVNYSNWWVNLMWCKKFIYGLCVVKGGFIDVLVLVLES